MGPLVPRFSSAHCPRSPVPRQVRPPPSARPHRRRPPAASRGWHDPALRPPRPSRAARWRQRLSPRRILFLDFFRFSGIGAVLRPSTFRGTSQLLWALLEARLMLDPSWVLRFRRMSKLLLALLGARLMLDPSWVLVRAVAQGSCCQWSGLWPCTDPVLGGGSADSFPLGTDCDPFCHNNAWISGRVQDDIASFFFQCNLGLRVVDGVLQ